LLLKLEQFGIRWSKQRGELEAAAAAADEPGMLMANFSDE
jgi:hypothetical protein